MTARPGAHLAAMRKGVSLATEIRLTTFESGAMPGWREAKRLAAEKGRSIAYPRP